MANPEHVKIVKLGGEAVDKWQSENPGAALDLSGAEIDGIDLSGVIRFNEGISRGTHHRVVLTGASLRKADFSKADLGSAYLNRTDLREANLSGANLCGADLSEANLCGADLRGANLREAVLSKANLGTADLSGANLREANLREANLSGANMSGADLRGANIKGATLRQAHLSEASLGTADLGGADLRGARINVATLREACLHEANLSRARLARADLSGADLRGANLSGADLREANLSRANLYKANLKRSRLIGANLNRAILASVKYDQRMLCSGIRVDSCVGNPCFRRCALDQEYIEAFRSRSRGHFILYLLWAFFTDCGRSLFRVGLLGACLAVLFGWIYEHNPHLLNMEGSANTPWTPYYYSIVTFTTLGFGDVTPATFEGELWVGAEVVVGYLMLGLLVSILANKVARRS